MAQQIKKKFILDDAVDGEKLKLMGGQAVRAIDSTSNVIELIKLDSQDKVLLKGQEAALKSYVDSADSQLASDIASEQTARIAAVSSEETARIAADGLLEDAIDAEVLRATGAESTLDGRITQEISDRQSGDSSTLMSAQAYADQKIAEIVNSAPQVLDTLKELADALGNDPNFATTISNQLGTLEDRLDSLEQDDVTKAYVDAADVALGSRIDSAESRLTSLEGAVDGPAFNKMRMVLTSANLQYVELDHEAISNSVVISIGRLLVHETEDYTVSVVDGKTRITWVNDTMVGGEEGVEDGDVVFATYAY